PDRPSESAPKRERPGGRHSQTYLVTEVVDGDTLKLSGERVVRLVGIDAPERGECGHREATAMTGRLVLGKRVNLTIADDNRDGYGRLLRYVTVGNRDVGLALIEAGLAVAHHDSRDGYGRHPRQQRYVAADKAAPDKTCPPLRATASNRATPSNRATASPGRLSHRPGPHPAATERR
ncbi:MAG: thermonuclease family protein, partial [Micromonosporaceae bacterium]